jgi:hypothetical protein
MTDKPCPNADDLGDCACNDAWPCTEGTPYDRVSRFVEWFGDGVVVQDTDWSNQKWALHSRDLGALLKEVEKSRKRLSVITQALMLADITTIDIP